MLGEFNAKPPGTAGLGSLVCAEMRAGATLVGESLWTENDSRKKDFPVVFIFGKREGDGEGEGDYCFLAGEAWMVRVKGSF